MAREKIDVSIAITAYNADRFVDRCIRSCLNQWSRGLKLEVIVVDDASTDRTPNIISKFGDGVATSTHSENRGVGAASATALSMANGRYFLRLDSDDFLSSFAIEFLFSVADNNPTFGFVFSDYYIVDSDGFKQELFRKDSMDKLLAYGAGVMFRTDLLRSAGGYDARLRDCEDFDILARVLATGATGLRLPVPLYRYRRHDTNLTSRLERVENIARMERKHEGIQHRSGQIHW